MVTTDFGSRDAASSIVLQADGKFVVGGDSGSQNLTDFAVARYMLDGTLDSTFDADGKVTTNVGSFDSCSHWRFRGTGRSPPPAPVTSAPSLPSSATSPMAVST